MLKLAQEFQNQNARYNLEITELSPLFPQIFKTNHDTSDQYGKIDQFKQLEAQVARLAILTKAQYRPKETIISEKPRFRQPSDPGNKVHKTFSPERKHSNLKKLCHKIPVEHNETKPEFVITLDSSDNED
ncbi:unnamed protein product [Ambrosiozyma monospora]|uniref:Unnamed protein product n=1 Tax=Ambrosiozyma monospora TaxID=43982 RepID=A0ACB5T1J2_AMBMO|nr:unnamed protein product [Ambrosiozyma monospora]